MMFNRYAYANNNPYIFLDPDGRDARDVQIIVQDISEKFPGMRSPSSVVYKDLPEGVAGQATLDAINPSLVLPTEAETTTLSKEQFSLLYDTILHESMHLTDPFWQRVWDGIWGPKKLTKNHQEIYARDTYEGIQPNGKPTEDVWDKDGTVENTKGINPSELYDETKEEESSEDAE